MKKGLWSLMFVLGTALAAPAILTPAQPAAAELSLNVATEAAIDAIASKVVEAGQSAGLAVGISIDGQPAFVRSYGSADLEHGIPVTDRTIFRVGSITKQFTAVAILLLAEDGKLALADPLVKYFPDFPRASEVTIRQLLNHTSGIYSYTSAEDFFPTLGRHDLSTDEMIAHIARFENLYDFEPGTSWSYSNSGYYLLGAIIEKISGQSYAAFMKSRIFDPLGLHDTAVDDTAEIVAHRAHGYQVSKDEAGKFTNAPYLSMSVAAAAGAMRSTAGDLLKWESALFGGRVLKPESLAVMIAPGRLKNGELSSTAMKPGSAGQPVFDYGLGIAIGKDAEGRRIIRHNGAINGFNTFMLSYPDQRVSFVVLANTGGEAAILAGQEIIKAFFATQNE